jgi:hypothetical protein
MKKVAFAILACAMLMLFAAPAWADVCGDAFPSDEISCGVTITITGTAGNLQALIDRTGAAYDGDDDQLVGITNNSLVKVGAIILSAPGLFAFDGDGACANLYNPPNGCPFGPTGYEGPNNVFKVISSDTGKVLFTTPLAANGGTTWFSLEGVPVTTVAIGENQTLTGNTQSIYKFGPGNPALVNPGPLAPGSEDDFKITPLKTASDNPTGDSLTVTPVPVPAWGAHTATNFQNLACVPYFDYSSNSNGTDKSPVCIELELDCSSPAEIGDSCNFQYTTQLDYGIYGDGLLNGSNSLIGGPHLLVQHDVPCPAIGFTEDIVLSYTGATAGPAASPDPPPIKGSGSPGHSCLVSAYDTRSTVPLIPQGVTVSTFFGFEFPVFNDPKKNIIFPPIPELLNWDSHDSSNNGVPNLHLCKAVNPTNASCALLGIQPPWVHLSAIPIANCASFMGADPLPGVFLNLSKLLGNGEYSFVWDTSKQQGPSGCQVRINLQFDAGARVAPALFQYH